MAKPVEIPGIDVRPLLDERGFVVLYDLWGGGQWVGSRRTAEQCEQYLSHLCGVPIEATPSRAW